jgi:hypothetical protein
MGDSVVLLRCKEEVSQMDIEKLKAKLMEDVTEEELLSMSREVNGYDGSLDWLRYESNDDEFFSCYFGGNVLEAVRAVCYGEYNYTDEYVKINAYGNLESIDEWGMERVMRDNKEEIIDEFLRLVEANSIDTYYIQSYIDELEDEEEEEEEEGEE